MFKALWKGVSIVLFEAMPELYFQTSLFSLTFREDDETHAFQLFSLALSSVSICRCIAPAFQRVPDSEASGSYFKQTGAWWATGLMWTDAIYYWKEDWKRWRS